jgi:hypothetical protein
MLVLDREAALDRWRRAEARIYPSVMVNAELYQQYIGAVRAVASELLDVKTEDDLVAAWHERRELVREVVSRDIPPMVALMDLNAVFDAAFCHRHRDLTREQGKALAAERLERAKASGAEWVVLFEDVTPLGSHVLEMHVASGRALHYASSLPVDASRPTFTLQVVQLDPTDGAWRLDVAPLLKEQTFDTREEWDARVAQARAAFGRR